MPALETGGIYFVTDSKLTLLPREDRQIHEERRRFVILSGSETNLDDSWPVILGCPISSSTSFKTRFDVKLAAGEAGTTKKCWIRIPAAQPLLKADLEDLTGKLDGERLQEVQARLLQYLGLITAESSQSASTS
jgi:mRNA-degrading endonuclease toxin of MazEF toxin-antitoxin module